MTNIKSVSARWFWLGALFLAMLPGVVRCQTQEDLRRALEQGERDYQQACQPVPSGMEDACQQMKQILETGRRGLAAASSREKEDAQAGNCSANVNVRQISARPGPSGTQFKYRIDVTSSEQQCAVVHFAVRRSYRLVNGSTFSATEPWSVNVRGGSATDSGELFESTKLPALSWSVEGTRCQKCTQ
jgi:hypothetical protein